MILRNSLWLLLVAHVYAASLSLQSPRCTISSSDASQLRADTYVIPRATHLQSDLNTNSLSLTQKPEPLTLGPSDTLKLTFQVVETGEGNGVQPHQTFLRFYDSVSGEEGIQPVRVTPGGKAKFELVCLSLSYSKTWPLLTLSLFVQNMARPPPSLPPTTDRPLAVSLILGSFVHDPATFDLFDLYVPASLTPPSHPDETFFYPQPPIAHTFHPEQKLPPKVVSAFFTALVLAPWVALLGLVRRVPLLHYMINSITRLRTVGQGRSTRPAFVLASYFAFYSASWCLRGSSRLVLGRSQAGPGATICWYLGASNHLCRQDCTRYHRRMAGWKELD